MNMHLAQTIRKYLGWCPNAQVRIRTVNIRPCEETVSPSAGGSFKARGMNWLGLFRNQVLLSSLAVSATGFWMFAGLGSWSSPGLFITGILAGVPFTAVTGFWYWRIFNEVIREGPVVLMNRQDRTSWTLTVLGIAVSFIPALVLFGAVPGMTMEMVPAFMGGFIGVLFWGMFIAVLKWESVNHRRIHFDGMILELEREETNAIG